MLKVATKIVVLTMAGAAAFATFPLPSGASTITQGPPLSGTTDVAGSSSYQDVLTATSGVTGTVTFTTSTPDFTIANDDQLLTTATLSAVNSPYTVTGDDSDTSSDDGTWSYTLTVTPDTILQGSPTASTTSAASSAAFTDTLAPSSGFVGPVTFTTSTPDFTIANDDELETTTSLSTSGSPYTVTGTDSDAYGDTGTWSYALTVMSGLITQGLPNSGNTSAASSATFNTVLTAASGSSGPVTFTTSTPDFTIANGDELETTSALSAADSPYTVTGTDTDQLGDEGSWSYVLNVAPSATSIPAPTTLTQNSPTTGTTSVASSATFSAGPLSVTGNLGAVTFITTSPSPALTVSSSGSIATTGPLEAGIYTVSGSDSDAHGDTGTWTYTLSVSAAVLPATATVTFHANGGSGTMASQSASAPTALNINHFTRTGYTFIGWSTLANGSGMHYANGSLYSFSASADLYARWKRGKLPDKTLTFRANGGKGVMRSEIDNSPTAISADHFVRTGYAFFDWNTNPNGSGEPFRSGETYPFTKSRILYAQWKISKAPTRAPKKKLYDVTFNANGGVGSMGTERHDGPAALTPNQFRRSGYAFTGWNSQPNGAGISYLNGATYSFSTSATLYAEWKKVTPPPPTSPPFSVTGGVRIGPFDPGSSSLTSTLKSQIQVLANEIKEKSETQITLYGFGDHEASATATDLALARARAESVSTYLQARLGSIGLKSWTVSIAPESPSQGEVGTVVASLS